jgi:hypothetical protein
MVDIAWSHAGGGRWIATVTREEEKPGLAQLAMMNAYGMTNGLQPYWACRPCPCCGGISWHAPPYQSGLFNGLFGSLGI